MAELTFKEGNIHDDIYWSPKQKENFILKHYKNSDRKELDKTAKEISDAIRADERNRILAKVDKALLKDEKVFELDGGRYAYDWEFIQKVLKAQLQTVKDILEEK